MMNITRSEYSEQVALMDAVRQMSNTIPELRLLFHIPNGGWRHKLTAVRLKRAGVKPGVPDLFLPVPRNGCSGLFIELKAEKGMATPNQCAWLRALQDQGYSAEVAYGAEEALSIILNYLQPSEQGSRCRICGDRIYGAHMDHYIVGGKCVNSDAKT
jgi:hypothetical protein